MKKINDHSLSNAVWDPK